MTPAIIPYGLSAAAYGRIRLQATRLAKYGPSRASAAGTARRSAALRALIARDGHWCARKTACPQGHPYVGANVAINSLGHRRCRTCARLRRSSRPVWVTVAGVRHSVRAHDRFYASRAAHLKARMIAAHPDKGGTATLFRRARRAWDLFHAEERRWYAHVGLALPRERRAPGRQRRDRCAQGHPITTQHGRRFCYPCHLRRWRESYHRRKARAC